VRLHVLRRASKAEVQGQLLAQTATGAAVYTDTHGAYDGLAGAGREHRAVDHNPRDPEYARDDDADGVREVHCNTAEGIWTGLRNFLRTFRGVAKAYLAQYVAVFEWAYNQTDVTTFLRALLGTS
jgi:transposase